MVTNTRSEREFSSVGNEASMGLSDKNNVDISGVFPLNNHWNSSNVNFAATGGKQNNLAVGGGYGEIPIIGGNPVPAEYPYNQVQETVSGHVIEVNDTAGGERILIKHKEGAGVDIRPDGSVIIVSSGQKVEINHEDQTVIVEGNANLIYKGDLTIKVTGDLNYDVGGNINVKTRNRNETILGSDRKTVNGNVGQIIRGGYSTTVTQQVTDTFLGGHSHNVKGTFSNNVNGVANYVSSAATVITSESKINMETPTGVVKSPDMILEVKGATYTKGVTAPTFHGDLQGTATKAIDADTAYSQDYSDFHGDVGSSPGYTANNTATPIAGAEGQPEISKVRKVLIDVGNYLKNYIDKSEAYGGIDTVEHDTGQARSRLRDPANRNNQKYISSVISEGSVSANIFQATPTGVGRIVTGNSSPKFGQEKIGQIIGSSATDPFLPKRTIATTILPDPLFNPDNKEEITSNTKLAPGITVGRFFGASGDPTNIDFIKDQSQRKSIAKHLYLHAVILRSIQLNKSTFGNFKLDVAEGVYRPGKDEKVTPGSINDLKTQGRAIVYELYDNQGENALSETFDLAEFWKDTVNFEKMILSYDMLDPKGNLRAQIILIMPEIDDNWKAKFTRTVETQFNNNKMSQGELVECTNEPSPPSQARKYANPKGTSGCPMTPPAQYTGQNGNLPQSSLVSIGGSHKLIKRAADAYLAMVAAAKKDGITWSITDSYRSYAAQYNVALRKGLYAEGGLAACPGRSNHGWGKAVDLGGGANNTGTPQNNWLKNNANRFGFYNIPREPWHWEYRG